MRAVLALTLLTVTASPALACTRPPSESTYAIDHATYGDIGRYVTTVTCDGDDLVIETDIVTEVKILMITAYRRTATYREVWRADRLVAFDSHFDDNGDLYNLKVRADGDQTVIEGHVGRVVAPATVISNHPWNHLAVGRGLLFDTRRGELQEVEVAAAGTETITVGGAAIAAHKYLVTGDLERELWYHPDGTWLQSRLVYGGDQITITHQ